MKTLLIYYSRYDLSLGLKGEPTSRIACCWHSVVTVDIREYIARHLGCLHFPELTMGENFFHDCNNY